MSRFARCSLLILALSASACSTTRYCMGEQEYHGALSIPPLQGTGELQIPVSQTALVIPDPSEGGLPYGRIETDESGRQHAVCLDRPPSMPPLPPPAPEAEPEAGDAA